MFTFIEKKNWQKNKIQKYFAFKKKFSLFIEGSFHKECTCFRAVINLESVYFFKCPFHDHVQVILYTISSACASEVWR